MTCPRCRHENEAGAKFCEECAAPLARACTKCGRPLSPTAKFCPECAHPTGSSAAPAPAQRFDSPESYTPKHLAEKILTSRAALEGERKQVTVLFADLKGSMELLADRDPEEARKLLDPVLERMMVAVHRYEGTVNQVMGDGIMALFGAPVAHEDHAARACYAALDLQATLRRYGDEVRRTHGIAVQVRVGLNSGEVVVRAIGSDLHMDYSAIGQTTHLAARMEQLATPGRTLLTADTLRLVEGYIEVTPLGPVPVKGLDGPVEIYELVGAGPRRSRLHAAAARGLTRFVGRDAELEQVRQALARAATGHGQLVAVVGEPGVGKSRLVWEVTHSHRAHGWLILQAGSVSYGQATPYLPIIDLLKAYFQVEDRDDRRTILEKLTGKLLTLDAALKPALPALLTVLDVPTDDPHWQALDPPQRRQRTLDAVKRLLLRESNVQPVLVALEDLHWIDSETQACLDTLVDSLPTRRIMLLLNYRPEYEHHWGNKTYCTQLRLDPLAPETADELLRVLLGDDASLDPLKALLSERTERNPFFLEESIRTLAESQMLAGERGEYRLAKSLQDIRLPLTVQAVLAARIDRLPPDEKRVLQAAAVIGQDVPYAILEAIAEIPADALRRHLARLQAAEFLYETAVFPDLEYTFKHALTHEVAYGGLVQSRRQELHGHIVHAIERLYGGRLAEHVERLAHHAVRGGIWGPAVTYLREAGTKAVAHSAYPAAIAYFRETLRTLTQVRDRHDATELAVDVWLELSDALYPLGEYEPALHARREAVDLASNANDGRRLSRALGLLCLSLRDSGQLAGALDAGKRAFACAETLGDLTLQATAAFRLGQVYARAGNHVAARHTLRQALETPPRHLAADGFGFATPRHGITARAWLAVTCAELGRFDEGLVQANEAVRLAETREDSYGLIIACAASGLLHLAKGDISAAIAFLERSLHESRRVNIVDWALIAQGALALAYGLTGHLNAAWELAERYDISELENAEGLPAAAEAPFLTGRVREAQDRAARLLALSQNHALRGIEAYAHRLLGEIAVHPGSPDGEAANGHYHQALALATELGMRPLVAHCHLGLGKLYRGTRDGAKAQEHLTTARAMYREMGMSFWLEKADAELGGVER
jgi:class 3 adenylate cyclase/tetratricopeptide (TPR) repeat protein